MDVHPSLTLANVLAAVGLDPSTVLLIRHPLSHGPARQALAEGRLRPYTSRQKPSFPAKHEHWLVFLGEERSSARFFACYQNRGVIGQGQFDLAETQILTDLSERLVIDWGLGTRSWWQKGTTAFRKPVLTILERAAAPFPGFERLILTYAELAEVVSQPRRYAQWHAAMRAVNAIYLIVDKHSGRQYVGSAYGEQGLLGRWHTYADTVHGGNKLLVEELRINPAGHQNLQFSVIQILPRTATADEVIAVETLHKRKLLTKEFGLNAN